MSTVAIPLNPQPISTALAAHFAQELSQIKSGKTLQGNLAITTTGVGAGIGVRKDYKKVTVEATAWGGREWTSGWLAGGKIGFSM